MFRSWVIVFLNRRLRFTCHNTARICYFSYFFQPHPPFFFALFSPRFIGILTHFRQKTASGAISWVYKGKSNFEKLRGKQDFLILLGFRYNFPKLTYGRTWVKDFYSLKTQMLNDSEWFWLVFWPQKMACGKMVGVLRVITYHT